MTAWFLVSVGTFAEGVALYGFRVPENIPAGYNSSVVLHVLASLLAVSGIARLRRHRSFWRALFPDLFIMLTFPGVGIPGCVGLYVTRLFGSRHRVRETYLESIHYQITDRSLFKKMGQPDDFVRHSLTVEPLVDVLQGTRVQLKANAIEKLIRLGTPSAIKVLRSVLNDRSPEVALHAANAIASLQEKLNRDIQIAELIADNRPHSAPAQVQLGNICYEYCYMNLLEETMKRFYLERSRAAYLRAVALEPVQTFVLQNLARCCLELGLDEEAVKHLNHLVERDPESSSARFWRCEANYNLGRFDAVRADCAVIPSETLHEKLIPVRMLWTT